MRWVVSVLLFVTGCSDAGKPPGPGPAAPPVPGLTAITVTPANLVLVVDGATPATQTYAATGTFQDGHSEDVTGRVSFTLSEGSLGIFKDNLLTTVADHGGLANVQALAGGVFATTGLTVMIRQERVEPSSGLPSDVAGKFSGAVDPQRAPEVVYPHDGVLLPPNFGGVEVHFLPGAGNSIFEVGFTNAITRLRVYTKCLHSVNGGCVFPIPANLWTALAQTNRGAAAIDITVRGTDDSGAKVGSSQTVAMSVSEDDLIGALYYWTTSNGTGIMRYDFADAKQKKPELFASPAMAGGRCIGCHALSRDGSKLVAEAGGQNSGELLLLDVARAAPLVPFPAPSKSTFESWSPDGTQFVGVYGDQGASDFNLMLFDGSSGAKVGSIAGTGSAAHPADHPDWSPDGKSIVYTRVGAPNTLQRMSMGAIEQVSNAGGGFSTPVELVAAVPGKNRYYPTFAPDSSFVVFDQSTCKSGGSGEDCDADSDPTATLFAVTRRAGAAPVLLARANAGGRLDGTAALTNSFPKFAPFVFRRLAGGSAGGEAGARLIWVTFSSSRHYGLRAAPAAAPGGENNTGSLIWMAAIDPDAIENGLDGSYPAFAIPFQDLTTSNHIAQWTTQVVPPIQ